MDDFVLLETTSCEASDTEKQLRHLKSSLNEEILTFDKKSKKKKKTAVTRSEFNLRVAVGFVITSLLAVSFGSSVANLCEFHLSTISFHLTKIKYVSLTSTSFHFHFHFHFNFHFHFHQMLRM
tara:strand:+ start:251 stop:619 length:369 start_codon:yes stop_codon:yes gene_type:complete